MSERVLVLIRHAKTVPIAATDAERELTDRGHRDAGQAAAWLAAIVPAVDLAVISPAVRARETWVDIAAMVSADDMLVDERIYDNTIDDLFAVLGDVSDDVVTLLLVGHSPSVHALAVALDDGTGDPDSSAVLASDYPTCGIAVFDVQGSWSDMADRRATLRTFAIP
jgi:phosphohistidine phosphatase